MCHPHPEGQREPVPQCVFHRLHRRGLASSPHGEHIYIVQVKTAGAARLGPPHYHEQHVCLCVVEQNRTTRTSRRCHIQYMALKQSEIQVVLGHRRTPRTDGPNRQMDKAVRFVYRQRSSSGSSSNKTTQKHETYRRLLFAGLDTFCHSSRAVSFCLDNRRISPS